MVDRHSRKDRNLKRRRDYHRNDDRRREHKSDRRRDNYYDRRRHRKRDDRDRRKSIHAPNGRRSDLRDFVLRLDEVDPQVSERDVEDFFWPLRPSRVKIERETNTVKVWIRGERSKLHQAIELSGRELNGCPVLLSRHLETDTNDGKRRHLEDLFPEVESSMRSKVVLGEDGSGGVTPGQASRKLTETIQVMLQGYPRTGEGRFRVVDGTAGSGADAAAFSRKFNVTAIEIDKELHRNITPNIKILAPTTFERIQVILGDFINLTTQPAHEPPSKLQEPSTPSLGEYDALYLDPLDVSERSERTIELSGMTLPQVVSSRLGNSGRLRVIVLKVPKWYDLNAFGRGLLDSEVAKTSTIQMAFMKLPLFVLVLIVKDMDFESFREKLSRIPFRRCDATRIFIHPPKPQPQPQPKPQHEDQAEVPAKSETYKSIGEGTKEEKGGVGEGTKEDERCKSLWKEIVLPPDFNDLSRAVHLNGQVKIKDWGYDAKCVVDGCMDRQGRFLIDVESRLFERAPPSELTLASAIPVYYQGQDRKWKFEVTKDGLVLLEGLVKRTSPLIEKCQEMLRKKVGGISREARRIERDGAQIYARKPNKTTNNVTWSQAEYGHLGFHMAYLQLKSMQRFTETYTLLERAHNHGLFRDLDSIKNSGGKIRVASLGGGPGFELLAFEHFCRLHHKGLQVEFFSLDLEASWEPYVKMFGYKFLKWDFSKGSFIEDIKQTIQEPHADSRRGLVDYVLLSYVFYHYMQTKSCFDMLQNFLNEKGGRAVLISSRFERLDKACKELARESNGRKLQIVKLIDQWAGRDDRQLVLLPSRAPLPQPLDSPLTSEFPNVPYEEHKPKMKARARERASGSSRESSRGGKKRRLV
ncbi:hypothetical protein AAMO2058_000955900 [Amorphochlora amoebiformis]